MGATAGQGRVCGLAFGVWRLWVWRLWVFGVMGLAFGVWPRARRTKAEACDVGGGRAWASHLRLLRRPLGQSQPL